MGEFQFGALCTHEGHKKINDKCDNRSQLHLIKYHLSILQNKCVFSIET